MIKNKDGTKFQLVKSNPLMISQDFFDERPILHNFNIQETTLEYFKKENLIPKIEKKVINVESPILIENNIIEEDFVHCWCLVGKHKETYDDLYNEKKVKIIYTEKFKFIGKVIDVNEFSFQIWADEKRITNGSIIFVKRDRRWWRVKEINGFVLSCFPSDFKPSFSED